MSDSAETLSTEAELKDKVEQQQQAEATAQENAPKPAKRAKPKAKAKPAAPREDSGRVETAAQRNQRLKAERRRVEKDLDQVHKKEKKPVATKTATKSASVKSKAKASGSKLTDEQMAAWIEKQLAKDPELTKGAALKAIRAEGKPMGSNRFFKAFGTAARKRARARKK